MLKIKGRGFVNCFDMTLVVAHLYNITSFVDIEVDDLETRFEVLMLDACMVCKTCQLLVDLVDYLAFLGLFFLL